MLKHVWAHLLKIQSKQISYILDAFTTLYVAIYIQVCMNTNEIIFDSCIKENAEDNGAEFWRGPRPIMQAKCT